MFEFALFVSAFVIGYAARKYVEKRWPDAAKLVDKAAKEKAEEAQKDAKQYFGPKE